MQSTSGSIFPENSNTSGTPPPSDFRFHLIPLRLSSSKVYFGTYDTETRALFIAKEEHAAYIGGRKHIQRVMDARNDEGDWWAYAMVFHEVGKGDFIAEERAEDSEWVSLHKTRWASRVREKWKSLFFWL